MTCEHKTIKRAMKMKNYETGEVFYNCLCSDCRKFFTIPVSKNEAVYNQLETLLDYVNDETAINIIENLQKTLKK
jgi:hypothetical protein